MRHPQDIVRTSEPPAEEADSSEFLTRSYSSAIDQLNCSFDEERPIAMVIGEGRSAAGFVIGKFLAGLDAEVAVARITDPCADAADLMRCIVRSVGFEPKDMGVTDLESILQMFLSFQKGHARRTVICMESIQDSGWWVLDRIRKLVDLEVEGNFGLMLVISGESRLKALMHTRPLSAISAHTGQYTYLLPFTMAETAEYIRRRAEGAGTASIDQAFHYQAITQIHELSEGIPDAMSALVSTCFDLADQAGLDMVTTEVVARAHEFLRAGSAAQPVDPDVETVNLSGWARRIGRLIVKISGEDATEMAVRQGHILIGRGKLCDIRVESPAVSRCHALITYTPDGATLADLRSTNGTFVDGHQVSSHDLSPGETIAVGDCRIEYILEDELQPGMPSDAGTSMLLTRGESG